MVARGGERTETERGARGRGGCVRKEEELNGQTTDGSYGATTEDKDVYQKPQESSAPCLKQQEPQEVQVYIHPTDSAAEISQANLLFVTDLIVPMKRPSFQQSAISKSSEGSNLETPRPPPSSSNTVISSAKEKTPNEELLSSWEMLMLFTVRSGCTYTPAIEEREI